MFANLRTLGQAAVAACVLVGWSGTGTAGAQSVCADLGGMVDPDQICHVHSASASYKIDFRFPVDYPDQQALANYLTREHDQLVSWVAQNPPRPVRQGRSYELVEIGTAYRSGTPALGTQSLVFQIGDDTGAHPVTYYKAFNYDLGKHAPITFDTLFKPGTKPLGVIYPAVRRELQERSGYDVLPPERGGLDVDTYQNFAITDDAVIFFFGAGPVLGPMDLGKAAVPRTQLASLLASP